MRRTERLATASKKPRKKHILTALLLKRRKISSVQNALSTKKLLQNKRIADAREESEKRIAGAKQNAEKYLAENRESAARAIFEKMLSE